MFRYFTILSFICLKAINASAQGVSPNLPAIINNHKNFLFYLHGAVVSVKGDNAINDAAPEWGRYEYSNILDSLRVRNFEVISEIRQTGIDDTVYANKIVLQIDTLLKSGVKPSQILLVGASSGWNIVLLASSNMKNPFLHFVMMGGCWPETYKNYSAISLFGHYLSIIEKTDPHGTCKAIFHLRKTMSSFREVELETGLSHGFFYKGHSFWIDPITDWFKQTR